VFWCGRCRSRIGLPSGGPAGCWDSPDQAFATGAGGTRGPSFVFDFEILRPAECTMDTNGFGCSCVVKGVHRGGPATHWRRCRAGLGAGDFTSWQALRYPSRQRSGRAVTEAWREDYNRVRPHGALGNRTPAEFARPVAGHAQLPALHGEQLGWYQDGGGVTSMGAGQ